MSLLSIQFADLLKLIDELSDEQKRVLSARLVSELAPESTDIPSRDSNEAHQFALDAAEIGIWSTNADGSGFFWDAQSRRIFGLTPDETASIEKGLSILHIDDRDRAQKAFEEATAPDSSGNYRVEKRVIWPDSSIHWVLASGRMQFVEEDGQRRASMLIGSVIDITASKQMEEALRVSEEKYRSLFDLFSQGFCICEMLVDENGKPYDYRFLEVNQLFEENTGLKDAAGKTALELVPNLEAHWFEIYGKVALTGQPLRFEQGSEVMGGRWFDVYAFRFGDPKNLQFAIVFNDISKRRQAEERGRLLQTLASSLSRVMTQQEVTEIILEKGMKDVGAISGTLAVLSGNNVHLEMIGSFGYSDEIVEKWQYIPLDNPTSLIALAVREGRQLWIHNAEEREQLIPMSPKLSEDEQPQAHAVVPFNIDNEFVGVIRLDFSTPREFAAPEQTFLITLMEYCAQALHRAKLTEQIGQLATARERQRLSRDLHDSVKQLLFASSTLAEGIPGLYERAPDRAKRYTNDLVNLNRAALAELQSLLFEMRPEAIVTTPFMDLVQNLCTALRGHKSITISIDYEGPEKIYFPVDVHVAFYRLVQETLNNVYKHSDATQLDIHAAYDNRRFNMTIRDNGKGFDLDNHATGFGMNTMRERAENVGAIFTIHSVVGEGTTVTLERQINATPSAY